MPNLKHERSICIHCGACTSMCSEYFDEINGMITLKGAEYDGNDDGVIEFPDANMEIAQAGVDCCPVACISIEQQ